MTNRLILAFVLFVIGCNNNTKTAASADADKQAAMAVEDSAGNFFPVTSYLRGEIYEIKNKGITPVSKVTIAGKMDSSWVTEKKYDSVFAPFLTPVIDTLNLKNLFTEKKFLDQTLNAYTFTYDPIPGKINDVAFTHWDVYVDPETGTVKRIYLTKKTAADTELRLTWQAGKWCKIITLKTINGTTVIDKEEKISWTYEE